MNKDYIFHTVGNSCFAKKPNKGFLYGAFISDLLILVFVLSCIVFLFLNFYSRSTAAESILEIILALGSIPILFYGLKKYRSKTTLGQKLWHLKKQSMTLQQKSKILFTDYLTSSLSFCLLGLLLDHQWQFLFKKNPLWQPSQMWTLEPWSSRQHHDDLKKQWQLLPFFYYLGLLPKTFKDQQLLYTIPYVSGPPKHFIDRILISLDPQLPPFKIILEGPKTPHPSLSQKTIQNCLSDQNLFRFLQPTCWTLRKNILSRHLQEMHSEFWQSHWNIQWFKVNSSDPVQGIYLRHSTPQWIQDRFILIHFDGIQQTLILNRPPTASGQIAFQLTQAMIQGMKGFSHLDAGKLWINPLLEEVTLPKINPNLSQLIQAQNLLISKISVDPELFDTYYHLAGTALLTLQALHPSQHHYRNQTLQNLFSAQRFGEDLQQGTEKNQELQKILEQAKKFENLYEN